MSADSPYTGVQARNLGRLKKREPKSFNVKFYTRDEQLFVEYLLQAKHEHEAWALAHAKLSEDYPEEDPGQYIFVIECT